MTGMFDLRDILELVNDSLDDGAFAQQNFVKNRDELVFHVRFNASNELKVGMQEKFFKKGLRNVTLVANQLAEKTASEVRNGYSIINIAGRKFHIQNFTSVIDN